MNPPPPYGIAVIMSVCAKHVSIHTVNFIPLLVGVIYIYTVWVILLYSMGHLSLQYGTSIYIVWDISHYSMGHLSIQYGSSFDIHVVWDVSHYH